MSQNVYIGMTLKPWPILLDHYTWTFPDNPVEYLRVSKEVFDYPPKGEEIDPKKLKLIPMTPKEWKEEYIEVDEMF